jgi:hypothetical protein
MNFPGDTDRLTIVGATGSGKTQAGMYHLSRRNIDTGIWIVYDFKRDELINEIESAQHIEMTSPLPERPGLYVVHPRPGNEDVVDEHMFRIWDRENIGVYVDEGYMVGNRSAGFRALLTQGRSKHIPMIVLSQRPVYMDKFVFSESQFFQVFRLQHDDDVSSAQKFIPFDLSERLPQYHSYYYDVVSNRLVVLSPVPDRDAILDTFATKLHQTRKVI